MLVCDNVPSTLTQRRHDRRRFRMPPRSPIPKIRDAATARLFEDDFGFTVSLRWDAPTHVQHAEAASARAR